MPLCRIPVSLMPCAVAYVYLAYEALHPFFVGSL